MSVATTPNVMTATAAPDAAPVLLHGISWQTYEMLLRDIGEQRIMVTFDRGDLEIMAPSPYHEHYKRIIGRLIEILTMALDMPILSVGSTTFKRKDLEKGLEPDECYYVQHERQAREKLKTLDLAKDPPPDLVVEMDYTHHAIDREAIYAALGVPEIWRFNVNRLEVLLLGPSGAYELSRKSLTFPFLPIDQLERFLQLSLTTPETTLARSFHDWVKANIRIS
jgi:Uma2 family endonuclease